MGSKTDDQHAVERPKPLTWLRVTVAYLLVPVLLLLCGWDVDWWEAWLFSLLIVGAGLVGRIWAERRHPGLLTERERALSDDTADAKPWDRVLAPLMAASLSYSLAIVAGLDHRFGWSPDFPIGLEILGFSMILSGYAFATWALVENRFFSSVVRIQADRGHAVCDSGPYRFVRHPGYAGNIPPLPGVVLALSSVWTLIPAAVALIILIVRTALEDRTLQEELPGYRDYAALVRYRLIPGLY